MEGHLILVVNLSNSTQTASEDFRIDAHGNHVAVFCWERATAAGAKINQQSE